jgi:hypothetical protein
MIVLEYISQSQNKIKTQKISISKQNLENSINLNNLIVSSSTLEREREREREGGGGGETKKEIKQKKAIVNCRHQHRFTHIH